MASIKGIQITIDKELLDALKEANKVIKRKNKLLKKALTQLIANEWERDIGVIADIEEELKCTM